MTKSISRHLKYQVFSVYLPFMLILSACQSLPQLFSAAEQIADDNAIKIEVQKEALNQNTNINITCDITNSEIKNAPQAR